MKKLLAIVLCASILLSCLPFSGLATNSANLLENATHASGEVNWDVNEGNTWGASYEDQHNGPFGTSGGYSWEFHPDKGGHDYTADPVDIYITCNDLAANTYYEFSYIYSKKFAIDVLGIADADNNGVSYALSPATSVSDSDTTAKRVTAQFQTNAAGAYTITLRINMQVYTSLSSFATILSDLSLIKLPDDTVLNLLSAATKANGQVTWDVNEGNTWGANYEDQHNGPFGTDGGYSWEFHPDKGGHDYTADPVDIYITCNNLEANTYYEFSYIYSKKFAIDILSITDASNLSVNYGLGTAEEVQNSANVPAKRISAQFKTNDAGSYTITLRINMKVYTSLSSFATVLSDLSLIKLPDDTVLNLLSSATSSGGQVTWDELAGAWGGIHSDGSAGPFGGYSWFFGMPNSSAAENKIAHVYITTPNLKKDWLYTFSFVYSNDFIIQNDTIVSAAGTPVEVFCEETDEYLTTGDRAHKITLRLVAKADGAHTITLKMAKGWNNQNCINYSGTLLSDLELYENCKAPIKSSLLCETGGTVSTSVDRNTVEKGEVIAGTGETITLFATPDGGNYFKGWYDTETGALISSEAEYTFTVSKAFSYTAKFDGDNMGFVDVLKEQNLFDGTFETGPTDVPGWYGVDEYAGDPSPWMTFQRSNDISRSGDYSLKFNARYRSIYYDFKSLEPNTDYYLSFYFTLTDPNTSAYINYINVLGEDDAIYYDSYYNHNTSSESKWIMGGTGWHKVNVYFNPGDDTTATLKFHYATDGGGGTVYFDDFSLVSYSGKESLTNGDFSTDAAGWGWWGDVAVTEDQTLSLAESATLKQIFKLDAQSSYTVSFRAKGSLTAGAGYVNTYDMSPVSSITSSSRITTDSTDWKDYSFTFFTGEHEATNLYFTALDDGTELDNIRLVKGSNRFSADYEAIDFETDRFNLKTSDPAVYEIYEATGTNDPNVHSGTKSLRFNAAAAATDQEYALDEAYLTARLMKSGAYRFTAYFKTESGNQLKISPDQDLKYAQTEKGVYTAASDAWQKVEFVFVNDNTTTIKALVSSVAGETTEDFYIDDITLTPIRPIVTEIGTDKKYTADLYNLIDNHNFEEQAPGDMWRALPSSAKITAGDAAYNDQYLHVTAGTFYVIPIPVDQLQSYYLSATLRGTNTDGYIGVSATADGKTLYRDADNTPASLLSANSTDWQRSAFRFDTEIECETVYLVISCTRGSFDVDNIGLCKTKHGMTFDPNVYTAFVPYDYDDLDSATCVFNGGVDALNQSEQAVDGSDTASPQTGDYATLPLWMAAFAISLLALYVLRKLQRRSV